MYPRVSNKGVMLIPEDGDVSSNEFAAYKRLWAAVFYMGLKDAAESLKLCLQNGEPWQKFEPLMWVYSPLNEPGSFLWLCDLFDLNPVQARGAWRQQVPTLLRSKFLTELEE